MRVASTILQRPPYNGHIMLDVMVGLGYEKVLEPLASPTADDVLLIWNRGIINDQHARRYEAAGASVIVLENGYFGREWRGGLWYAMARSQHNGAGSWVCGGEERFQSFGIGLLPWRERGDDIVILAQRGMGSPITREPIGWPERTQEELQKRTTRQVRIRKHPGKGPYEPAALANDIMHAHACVTWASSAGLKSIQMGVPVFYGMPKWIGSTAALPLVAELENTYTGDRIPMFSDLAWAMWTLEEIKTGEPFERLLNF